MGFVARAFTAERHSRGRDTRMNPSGIAEASAFREAVVVRVGPLVSEWAAPCPGCPPEKPLRPKRSVLGPVPRATHVLPRRLSAGRRRSMPHPFATPPTGLAGPALPYIGRKRAFSGRAGVHLRP
jgi:hypothetical protein